MNLLNNQTTRGSAYACPMNEMARIRPLSGGNYEESRQLLVDVFEELRRFLNPVRLATVLLARIDLEMRFLRNESDLYSVLESELQKTARVYESCHHSYLLARTRRRLGDLELARARIPKAILLLRNAQRESPGACGTSVGPRPRRG